MSVGGFESRAFKEQSMNYAAGVRGGGHALYEEIAGVHHFSIADRFAEPASPIGIALRRFLDC